MKMAAGECSNAIEFYSCSNGKLEEDQHSDSESSKCSTLDLSSPTIMDKEINSSSSNLPSLCKRCGKTLVTDFCLCVYKIPFKCEKCFIHLDNLKEFQMHMKTHAKVSSLLYKPQPTSKSSRDKTFFECSSCKEMFNTELGLMAHSLNHSMKVELNIYKCPNCSREFTSLAKVDAHIAKIHEVKNKLNCNVCNKIFSSFNTLDAHKKLHLGIKPYKCDICGKGYSQSGNLAYHKSTHSGVKSYVCHLCGKAFLTSGILASHERRHSGLKPYVCDLCGRAFADNYALTHHKVIHSGIRSFMCDVCGKSFVHKHTLSSHKRIHTGDKRYRCTICERAFTQMSTMLQHRNTHTGEKSYRCLCGKTFSQQSSLARHKRLHAGIVESYPCNLCEKNFGYKSTLYKHKRRTHGIISPHKYLEPPLLSKRPKV